MQSSQGRPFLSRHFLGLASAHQPAPSCSRHLMHLPGAISIAQFRNLTKVCLDPASASCFSLLQRSICHSLFFFLAPSSASFCYYLQLATAATVVLLLALRLAANCVRFSIATAATRPGCVEQPCVFPAFIAGVCACALAVFVFLSRPMARSILR